MEIAWELSIHRCIQLGLKVDLPETQSVTLSGVLQESLQRLAKVGDECTWGPLHLKVLEMPFRGHMLVELQTPDPLEESR